jgi:hypothetical protein
MGAKKKVPTKKNSDFLPESIIQAFEHLPEQDLTDELSTYTNENLIRMFVRMLRSYRLAARVANAALRICDKIEVIAARPLQGNFEGLREALSHYAPENWDYATAHELGNVVEELQALYDATSSHQMTQMEMLQYIELRIEKTWERLENARQHRGDV